MKKREKILMLLTIVAALGGAVYSFGLGDFFDELSAQGDKLRTAQEEYVGSIETLKRSARIRREFDRFGEDIMQFGDGQLRPELRFPQEVMNICTQLKIAQPGVEPAGHEVIGGVEDYEFLTVRVRVSGDLDTIVNLLKTFEIHRLLFREVDLRGTKDSPTINAVIVVARLAPVPESEIQARQKIKDRARKSRPRGFNDM